MLLKKDQLDLDDQDQPLVQMESGYNANKSDDERLSEEMEKTLIENLLMGRKKGCANLFQRYNLESVLA